MVTKTKVVILHFNPTTNELIGGTSLYHEPALTLEKAEEICKDLNPVNRISYRPPS